MEPATPMPNQPIQTEQVQTEAGPVEFQMEDEFNVPEQEDGPNFTPGREAPGEPPMEKSPSGTSSPDKSSWPGSGRVSLGKTGASRHPPGTAGETGGERT